MLGTYIVSLPELIDGIENKEVKELLNKLYIEKDKTVEPTSQDLSAFLNLFIDRLLYASLNEQMDQTEKDLNTAIEDIVNKRRLECRWVKL